MPQFDQVPRENRTRTLLSRRRRKVHRQRAAAVMTLMAAVAILVFVIANVVSTSHPASGARREPTTPTTPRREEAGPRARQASGAGGYRVGVMTLHLIDSTRTITLPGGQVVSRPVTTIVRYPTLARAGGPMRGSRPAGADGPFPLIIFGHGFDLMPGVYSRLLHYWTRAGFVVATPIFPLENPEAPGGPDESDLPNQPQDMRFVISSLLHLDARPGGRLSGLIDAHEIAVAGHSDGGDTALALAYDPALRDPHLQAAVILSGAEIPMISPFQIAPGGPPLLATQGTADTINLPSATAAFFGPAPSPKYLLRLLGGSHLGPYSTNRVQLGVVERVTTAFLKYYLDHDRAAMRKLLSAGRVPGVATLQADLAPRQ
jgi:dienelactone hydrolase